MQDSIKKVRDYLKPFGIDDKIMELPVSSATVALAAQAVGTEPARIAKTLAFDIDGTSLLIVCAGDTKIDNAKYTARFHAKAKMLPPDEVPDRIGHAVGGVCPFAVKKEVSIFLDISLKRFPVVYPACGSANSAIALTPEEIFRLSGASEWVDVCKLKDETHIPQIL